MNAPQPEGNNPERDSNVQPAADQLRFAAGRPSERDGTLIPFPTPAGGQVEPAPEVLEGGILSAEQTAVIGGRLSARAVDRLPSRVVVLARGVAESPRTAQLKAVVGYRVRKVPRDVARLCWFALRGHGRWIAKAWIWATHGDLRADARAARLAGDREVRRAALPRVW
jgi:hypothetical protein